MSGQFTDRFDVHLPGSRMVTLTRPQRRDLVTHPHLFPIFKWYLATRYTDVTQYKDDGQYQVKPGIPEEEAADAAKLVDELNVMAQTQDEDALFLICKYAVSPTFYDPDANGSPLDDEAVSIRALSPFDLTTIVSSLIMHASGIDYLVAKEEAESVGRFREEPVVQSDNAHIEAVGNADL